MSFDGEFEPMVPRPTPRPSPFEPLLSRFDAVDNGRLIAIGVAAIGVVVVGAWLLRASPAPVEASLDTVSAVESITLPSILSAPTPSVVVHVAGAVADPGVHRLDGGSRVVDAIAAAGGSIAGADLDLLNLAAVLVDGQRIHVPLEGEPVEAAMADSDAAPGPININTADQRSLESLPGIGPTTAAAIIDDRDRRGRFSSVEDLDRVAGIGPATIERLRDAVTT